MNSKMMSESYCKLREEVSNIILILIFKSITDINSSIYKRGLLIYSTTTL